MTPSEVAELLAVVASFDRRTVGRADIAAWTAVLADLGFVEARDAVVAHYTNSTDWLMPAHLIAIVRDRRALAPSTTWCGQCNERTRQVEDPETHKPLRRCECHPLNRKARL